MAWMRLELRVKEQATEQSEGRRRCGYCYRSCSKINMDHAGTTPGDHAEVAGDAIR
jgi:hypothetical protein